MTRRFVFTTAAIVLFGIGRLGFAADQEASISGTVLGDGGTPVANALVMYEMAPEATPGGAAPVPLRHALHSAVTRAQDGTFTIAGLQVGTYYLCAAGLGPTDLRECEWIDPGITIELGAGQSVNGVNLKVAEGTLLVFNVRDPKGLIHDLADSPVANGQLPISGANFGIGVFVGSRYARASLFSNNADLRVYRLAVPKNASFALVTDTSLTVTDGVGGAVPTDCPGPPTPVQGRATITIDLAVQ